jgi:dihydrolipoamide dehydrogenase
MNEFDVIVIGGGPGGYVAAARASQLGLKTAVVEKEQFGGTCVNWGCIPTKALLRNAEVVHLLAEGRTFGFQYENLTVDYTAAYNRSRQVAKRQAKRVEALLKNRKVSIFRGEGRLISANEVEVSPSGEKLIGKSIILAMGSNPRKIPSFEFDGDKVITSREALDLKTAPASVVIVGAGPIGMEFATVWNRYGSKVTVLEMMPYVLPAEDRDVSVEAKAYFEKRGIEIKNEVRVQGITKTPEGVEVTVAVGEATEVILAEKALICTGFAPTTENLGLEELGVAMNRGYIVVNHEMRSNVPNIYAIGDITGKMGLAHVASAQGVLAAEAIAGHAVKELIYENVPRCIFGEIEVASVGLTEVQAQERGHEVITVKSPFVPNGKALALNENSGFVKIVADAQTKRVLGVHMVGSNVPELIAGPTSLIALGATVEQMADVVYAHPTLSEALLEGAHALAGHAIHL